MAYWLGPRGWYYRKNWVGEGGCVTRLLKPLACLRRKSSIFPTCWWPDRKFDTIFKWPQSRLNGLKSLAKLFDFVVCNPCQSSPSLAILVPLWFIIISLMFFYLCKVLFSGFLQFNGNFVHAQNNSKYRDWVPLRPLNQYPVSDLPCN